MDDKQLDVAMATVHELLLAENMTEAADVVRLYPIRAVRTGYDNWNGGTEMWDVYIDVPAKEYVRFGARRQHFEEQITARLKVVLEPDNQDWYSAKIVPGKVEGEEWRHKKHGVPRRTRANILDSLRLERVNWSGSLNEVEFLSRIFDLQSLPSYDLRFSDSSRDIWQHCINNNDWEFDWVFSDDRFQLLEGPDDVFLEFLCLMVNPVVRPDRDEAIALVSQFNDQLHQVGLEIHEEEKIAGRPRFSYRKLGHPAERSVVRARSVADALDAGWMARAIARLERAVDSDPDLAIGTSKELVESCCKTILSKRGVDFTKSDDLGDLTKKITKELRLVPEGITDESKGAENIRLILRNLTQLTSNLARLRGLYGTGHGRDGQHRGLQSRHARLAVASAVAFIDFVTETYSHQETLKRRE